MINTVKKIQRSEWWVRLALSMYSMGLTIAIVIGGVGNIAERVASCLMIIGVGIERLGRPRWNRENYCQS